MTLKRLKSIVSGLLTGDNVMPSDKDVILGLLGMAFSEVSTHANSLRLITIGKSSAVARLASEPDYHYRYPVMPESDEDELDIDEELSYPVARFVASYVSDKKMLMHKSEAMRLIREYNSKVAELLTAIYKDVQV